MIETMRLVAAEVKKMIMSILC